MLADPAVTAHTRLHKCFFFKQIRSLTHLPRHDNGGRSPHLISVIDNENV